MTEETTEQIRARIDALMADMVPTTRAMIGRGLSPAQAEDVKEVKAIIDRIHNAAWRTKQDEPIE